MKMLMCHYHGRIVSPPTALQTARLLCRLRDEETHLNIPLTTTTTTTTTTAGCLTLLEILEILNIHWKLAKSCKVS